MRATRMGDDLFGAFRYGIKSMPDTEQYTHDTASALFDECERARSEEARLLEENKRLRRDLDSLKDAMQAARDDRAAVLDLKDATITALADALRGALKDIRGRMGHRLLTEDGEWCACEDCSTRLAALRLAGRLP